MFRTTEGADTGCRYGDDYTYGDFSVSGIVTPQVCSDPCGVTSGLLVDNGPLRGGSTGSRVVEVRGLTTGEGCLLERTEHVQFTAVSVT